MFPPLLISDDKLKEQFAAPEIVPTNDDEIEWEVLIQLAQLSWGDDVNFNVFPFVYLFTVGENLTKATQNPDKIWSASDWSDKLASLARRSNPTQPLVTCILLSYSLLAMNISPTAVVESSSLDISQIERGD